MPIIKPAGLLRGERMTSLSTEAKLYWPFFYAGSNGYGRFRIDYLSILERCFANFSDKPAETTVLRLLMEYRDQHLLFVYETTDGVWGAWDSAAGQRYFNAEDNASPAPPEPKFSDWKRAYQDRKSERSKTDRESLGNSLIYGSAQKSLLFDADSARKTGVLSDDSAQTLINTTPTPTSISTQSFNTTQTSTPPSAPVSSQPPRDPPPPGPRPAPIEFPGPAAFRVDGWDDVVELGTVAGMSLDPDPTGDLCQKVWRYLGFSDRVSCIDGIRKRLECGQYSRDEPQYVPTLRNYIDKRLWRESLRPRSRDSPTPKTDAAMEEAKRRIARRISRQGGQEERHAI